MTATDAIRFLGHEARECRGRGAADAICVLLPVILSGVGLQAMNDTEAKDFLRELQQSLKNDLERAA